MGSTFGKDDELNRPSLGNYRLALPFALYLKRSPAASQTAPTTYLSDVVILDRLESYAVDEEFAVSIRPTVDGGKYITNRGIVLRDIIVSGSTGYMPNGVNTTVAPTAALLAPPGTGGVISPDDAEFSLGNVTTFNSSELVGINKSNPQAEQNRQQQSGFLKFVKLRNLIREYARIKRFETPEVANSTFLFFYDRKLDEWWIVEPLKFRMFRSNKRNFLFDYTIPLKTIAPGSDTGTDPFTVDLPTSKQKTITMGVSLGLSGGQNEALAIVKRLVGISSAINAFAGKYTGLIKDAFNAVLNELDQVTAIFGNVAQATETLAALPAGLAGRLNNSLDGMLSQVARLSTDLQLISATNDIYIETRTLSDGLFARANQLFSGQSSTESPASLLQKENDKYTKQRMLYGSGTTAVNDPNGTTTLPTSPFVNGSGLNLLTAIDFTRYTGTKQAVVMAGDTLETLALREGGSVFLKPMIIALNKLQFPYLVGITAPYLPGTLRVGDKIQIPSIEPTSTQQPNPTQMVSPPTIQYQGQVTTPSAGNTVTDANQTTWRDHQWAGFTFVVTSGTGLGQQVLILDNVGDVLTLYSNITVDATTIYQIQLIQQQKRKTVSALEVRYGIDVLVVFGTGPSPVGVARVVFGPTGDLVPVNGLNNYIQALNLLSYTERGRNIANPNYGVEQVVGSKNTQETSVAYAFSLRAGILADPRTQSIQDMQFVTDRDTTSIVVRVIPVGGTAQVLALPSPV